MAYDPLYPFLPNKAVFTHDHLMHMENGIATASTEARGYVDQVAVEIQSGQVTDAAFDAAVDRAAADGRLVVEGGGGVAQDLTISEMLEGVYEIADGTGQIFGLTSERKLPAAAKTDLAATFPTKADITAAGYLNDATQFAPAIVGGNVPARRGEFALSPLNYGAVGDGVTSDQAALTATIAAAVPGRIIDLGGRTYNVGSGLSINKDVVLRNGALTAANNRVAIVISPDVWLLNVKVTRTGSGRTGSTDSALTLNAEHVQLADVKVTTTIGDALRMGNGACNRTKSRGGHYETADTRESFAVHLMSGPAHNYDVKFIDPTIRHTGYGTGMAFYNCSRCTWVRPDVRGIRASPWFYPTGWTLVSGTVYRAVDRTDTESNAVYVNGVEYRKNSPSDTTTPALNYYTVPGDGYIYINTGVDPSTQTVRTRRTNGYGLLMYATSSETVGMSDNLVLDPYVEDTDGFGMYYQTLQNVPRNNRLVGGTFRNVCKMGVAVADLPFAGVGYFGGLDLKITNTIVDGAGTTEYPCPAFNFKASVGTPHMTGTLTGITAKNATSHGVQLAPGSWVVNGPVLQGNAGHGVTTGTSRAGDTFDVELNGMKALSNVQDAGYFETTTAAVIRVRVNGGQGTGNRRSLVFARCRDVYVGGGFISEQTSNYGVTFSNTNIRVTIDGVFFGAGQGLSIPAGIADLTIGDVKDDGSSGTKFNVTGPYKVLGATGGAGTWRCTGTPEGQITARVGSTALRSDGGAGTTFYVKETGTGNTGWVAK